MAARMRTQWQKETPEEAATEAMRREDRRRNTMATPNRLTSMHTEVTYLDKEKEVQSNLFHANAVKTNY